MRSAVEETAALLRRNEQLLARRQELFRSAAAAFRDVRGLTRRFNRGVAAVVQEHRPSRSSPPGEDSGE